MTGEGSLFDVPPAAIGRFRVLHQVGAGTCGPVFRATDPDADRAVAIKLFSLSLPPERAATLVSRLEQLVSRTPPLAAAVSPVAAGLYGQTPFLATTFASGDSLDVALRQFGPAALEDLVPRLRALAGALDAAASRGVLHGALHPRDVLVSELDTALTGLGVWPLLGELGVRLPVRRPYRAPELTDAAASPAGDRFALAALAYEWMTGRRAPAPFAVADMAPLPGVDRERLALVFARALHASADRRYPSCAEFVSAVARVAADAEPQAPAVDTRPRRRGRAAAPTLPLDAFPSEILSDAPGLPQPSDDLAPPSERVADAEDVTTQPSLNDSEGTGEGIATAAEASPLANLAVDKPGNQLPIRRLEPPMFASAAPAAAADSGLGRLAAAALLGVLLGVGLGYAIWGRAETGETAAMPPAGTGPAVPPPSPSATDTGTPQPAQADPSSARAESVAPPARAAAPEPDSTAPQAQAAPAVAAAPGPPAARAQPLSGSLLIRSTPPGAMVFVDDERKGVTPLAVRALDLGTRRVRVQRDGFDVENRQVTLTEGRPSRSLDVPLRPLATAAAATPGARTGTLVIESRPSGATALVNGRSVGTTPLTLDALAPGSYSVQLQLAGFRPVTTTVRVVAGSRARAAASLTGAQEPK